MATIPTTSERRSTSHADRMHLLAAAMCAAQEQASADGEPGGAEAELAALRDLGRDPKALAEVFGDGEDEPEPPTITESRHQLIESDWQQFTGPRGGQGWKNSKTGTVHYGDKPPGEGEKSRSDEPGDEGGENKGKQSQESSASDKGGTADDEAGPDADDADEPEPDDESPDDDSQSDYEIDYADWEAEVEQLKEAHAEKLDAWEADHAVWKDDHSEWKAARDEALADHAKEVAEWSKATKVVREQKAKLKAEHEEKLAAWQARQQAFESAVEAKVGAVNAKIKAAEDAGGSYLPADLSKHFDGNFVDDDFRSGDQRESTIKKLDAFLEDAASFDLKESAEAMKAAGFPDQAIEKTQIIAERAAKAITSKSKFVKKLHEKVIAAWEKFEKAEPGSPEADELEAAASAETDNLDTLVTALTGIREKADEDIDKALDKGMNTVLDKLNDEVEQLGTLEFDEEPPDEPEYPDEDDPPEPPDEVEEPEEPEHPGELELPPEPKEPGGESDGELKESRVVEARTPPRPGLVFDETSHRWVRPEEGDSGASKPSGQPSAPSPPDLNTPAAKSLLARAKAAFTAAAVKVLSKGHEWGPDILDTADDWMKLTMAKGYDSLAGATGVPAQTAILVMSHAIAHAMKAIKQQLKEAIMGAASGTPPDLEALADMVIAILQQAGAEMGMELEPDRGEIVELLAKRLAKKNQTGV